MVVFQSNAKATLAGITVECVLATAHSAYAAFITVKNVFFYVVVIVKNANFTEIARELNSAVLAILYGTLDLIAIQAFDLCDLFPVDLMILFWVLFLQIFDIIMADSARKKFFTFRALFMTIPFVMRASKICFIWLDSKLVLSNQSYE